jgi:hypothetical protein
MKPTSITIKYDTGSLDVADGERAAQILAWWQFCETHVLQHGVAKYTGPPLKRITCLTQEAESGLVKRESEAGR